MFTAAVTKETPAGTQTNANIFSSRLSDVRALSLQGRQPLQLPTTVEIHNTTSHSTVIEGIPTKPIPTLPSQPPPSFDHQARRKTVSLQPDTGGPTVHLPTRKSAHHCLPLCCKGEKGRNMYVHEFAGLLLLIVYRLWTSL